MNSVEINNLSKNYSGFSLSDISFEVPNGTIVGLVGENGAGKSTIINAILNLIEIDSGEVKVFSKSNQNNDFADAKQDIGVVIDEAFFPEILTVKNVEKFLRNTFNNFDSKQFFNLVERFNLPINKKLSEFSRGMKMKLGIISALSHNPKLLILDEATSGLDPFVREEILELLYDFTKNEINSVLISSHIISDLEKNCDYIAFIHKGRLILFDEKDEIKSKYGILKLSGDEATDIAQEAIIKRNVTQYYVELLVHKDRIPSAYKTENSTLEDIIILLSKGVK